MWQPDQNHSTGMPLEQDLDGLWGKLYWNMMNVIMKEDDKQIQYMVYSCYILYDLHVI